MATIQFSGLSTGLDTNALITGLLQVERRSINILELQKVRFQAQSGVLTTLSGSLAGLKTSSQALSLTTDFNKRTVVTTEKDAVTAAADSTADLGTHDVVVDQLARAKSIRSTSYTSTSDAVGTGTLTISVGSTSGTSTTDTKITIDSSNNTLQGLKEAINGSGAAVSASIINVGTSSSPDHRLVVQSKKSGTDNSVTISGTLSGGTDPFGSGGGDVVQAAEDAVFFVDTLKVTRSSNVVSDVLTGVTFTLLKGGDKNGALDATDPLSTLTISSDTDAIKDAIGSFVADYNAVADLINDQFTLDPDTEKQGALAGDASVRGVLSRLRTELSRKGGIGVGFLYLSDIGIEFQKDGTLKVDDAKLTKSLDSDFTAAANLFLLTQNGIGKRIPDAVDDFISSVDGSITFRQEGINNSINGIDKKIEREEKRLAALEQRLISRFAALEVLVSEFKKQSEFLSNQLAFLLKS